MGEWLKLRAADGFELDAYREKPAGVPKGGLVVVQEVFGVNDHMRRVVEGFAADGFDAIAPALFDRIRPGVELGYEGADREEAMALKGRSSTDLALADIEAARAIVARSGKVAIVGYCWGGFLSWLAATRLPGFSAAISYYGGGIGGAAGETPRCPVLAHFGARDQHVGADQVEALRRAHPTGVEIHVHPADHGFNCDARASYDPASAARAGERSVTFLEQHLAG